MNYYDEYIALKKKYKILSQYGKGRKEDIEALVVPVEHNAFNNIISYLCSLGIDINYKNDNDSAFEYCVKNNKVQYLKTFLQ